MKEQTNEAIQPLDNESGKQFEALLIFTELGNLKRVSEKTNVSISTLLRWKKRFNWASRSELYKKQLNSLMLLRQRQEYLQKLEQHKADRILAGELLFSGASQLLQKLNKYISTLDITSMKPEDLGMALRSCSLTINAALSNSASTLAIQEILDALPQINQLSTDCEPPAVNINLLRNLRNKD